VGIEWALDVDYRICCEKNDGSGNEATVTTARGPGSKLMFACYRSNHTCTDTAPFFGGLDY